MNLYDTIHPCHCCAPGCDCGCIEDCRNPRHIAAAAEAGR